MNIPKIDNTELELRFTDTKINQNPELVELFKKTQISLEGFMLEFRKFLINEDFNGLLQLAYNNFEPRNQQGTYGGFDILAKLLQEININTSGENLSTQAKTLGIKKAQDIRVSKLHAILDATDQKY